MTRLFSNLPNKRDILFGEEEWGGFGITGICPFYINFKEVIFL